MTRHQTKANDEGKQRCAKFIYADRQCSFTTDRPSGLCRMHDPELLCRAPNDIGEWCRRPAAGRRCKAHIEIPESECIDPKKMPIDVDFGIPRPEYPLGRVDVDQRALYVDRMHRCLWKYPRDTDCADIIRHLGEYGELGISLNASSFSIVWDQSRLRDAVERLVACGILRETSSGSNQYMVAQGVLRNLSIDGAAEERRKENAMRADRYLGANLADRYIRFADSGEISRTESELAESSLEVLSRTFYVEQEVWGTHWTGKRLRLDAVLRPRVPTGWRDGAETAFGIEFKSGSYTRASGLHQAAAQAADYANSTWGDYGPLTVFLCPSPAESIVHHQARGKIVRLSELPEAVQVSRILWQLGVGGLSRIDQYGWTFIVEGGRALWSETMGISSKEQTPSFVRRFGNRLDS